NAIAIIVALIGAALLVSLLLIGLLLIGGLARFSLIGLALLLLIGRLVAAFQGLAILSGVARAAVVELILRAIAIGGKIPPLGIALLRFGHRGLILALILATLRLALLRLILLLLSLLPFGRGARFGRCRVLFLRQILLLEDG